MTGFYTYPEHTPAMQNDGLKVLEIRPDSSDDIEALLFENFLALAQTVQDGNRIEIFIHYDASGRGVQQQQPPLFAERKGNPWPNA